MTVVPDLAAAIDPEIIPTSVRIGIITAVESTGERRVKADIGGDTWLNRTQDVRLAIGDRCVVIQQGPVMVVMGRLTGSEALVPVGAVMPYASATIPTGWLLCDGSAVSRTTYAALFAIVGTTFGAGNGTTTFNIPSLGDRMPVGKSGTKAVGATGGAATVALASSEMPSHTHSINASGTSGSDGGHNHSISGSADSAGSHSHSYESAGSRNDLLASGGSGAATANSGSTGSAGGHSHSLSGTVGSVGDHTHGFSVSGTSGSAGSGNAHENMPPWLSLSYIIRAA